MYDDAAAADDDDDDGTVVAWDGIEFCEEVFCDDACWI